MLKKAGIVLAAATAGVLALTPLAFAGDKSHDADKHWGKGKDHHTTVVHKTDNVSKDNVSNNCQFGNQGGDASQGLFGGSSLLGVADVLTGAVTNATSQLNTLNCTNVNVSDLVDNNSNNSNNQAEETFVRGSFNG